MHFYDEYYEKEFLKERDKKHFIIRFFNFIKRLFRK